MTGVELPSWGGWMRWLLDAAAPLSWRPEVPDDLFLPTGEPWPADHLAYTQAYAWVWLQGGAFRSSKNVGTDGVGGLVPTTSDEIDDAADARPPDSDELFGDQRWTSIGVTRSPDGPWGEIPSSSPWDDAPVVRAMQVLNISSNAVRDRVIWGPADDHGHRALGVLSAREPEIWWFAMSVPEFAVRLLTGTHGCPWLPPSTSTVAVEIEDWDRGRPEIDGIANQELPRDEWRDRFGAPREATPATVVVLRDDLAPGGRRLPQRPGASAVAESIAALAAVVTPPEFPTVRDAWGDLADAAGGAIGDELVELLRRYGAGEFDGGAIELHDPPLCTSKTRLFREAIAKGQIEISPALQIGGGTTMQDAVLVHWATIDIEDIDLIWWAVGAECGCATLTRAPYVLEPVPSLPASLVADALIGTRTGNDWDLYDGSPPSKHTFEPYTFEE